MIATVTTQRHLTRIPSAHPRSPNTFPPNLSAAYTRVANETPSDGVGDFFWLSWLQNKKKIEGLPILFHDPPDHLHFTSYFSQPLASLTMSSYVRVKRGKQTVFIETNTSGTGKPWGAVGRAF